MPLGFDTTDSDLMLVLQDAAEQPGVLSDGLPWLDHEGDAAVSVAPSGERRYAVNVTVDPRSDRPAVRAYQALMELASHGTSVRSTPSEQDLQSGEGGQTLLVTLTSAHDAAALREAVATVCEIVGVEVRPLTTAADRRQEQRKKPGAVPFVYTSVERRRIDLGPELRGASAEEQLAAAGERMARLSRLVKLDRGRLDELLNRAGEPDTTAGGRRR